MPAACVEELSDDVLESAAQNVESTRTSSAQVEQCEATESERRCQHGPAPYEDEARCEARTGAMQLCKRPRARAGRAATRRDALHFGALHILRVRTRRRLHRVGHKLLRGGRDEREQPHEWTGQPCFLQQQWQQLKFERAGNASCLVGHRDT
eukprot:1367316-Prymnesium_polylepis.2